MENMMLSKPFDKSKLIYPCYISEKYDGVPGIYIVKETGIECISRQGTPITSTKHIIDALSKLNLPLGTKIIGEHYINGKPFSDISGKVRKNEQCTDLKLLVFDILNNNEDKPFIDRLREGVSLLNNCDDKITIIRQFYVENEEMLESQESLIIESSKKNKRVIEGIMYRNGNGTYDYTRSWNCMKKVFEATIDLRVVDVVEAMDKNENFLNRIGSFICTDLKGKEFIVSAGKADYTSREQWFKNPETIIGKIVVVKYKPDSTYKGLRQPTFQRIHNDKIIPDEVING